MVAPSATRSTSPAFAPQVSVSVSMRQSYGTSPIEERMPRRSATAAGADGASSEALRLRISRVTDRPVPGMPRGAAAITPICPENPKDSATPTRTDLSEARTMRAARRLPLQPEDRDEVSRLETGGGDAGDRRHRNIDGHASDLPPQLGRAGRNGTAGARGAGSDRDRGAGPERALRQHVAAPARALPRPPDCDAHPRAANPRPPPGGARGGAGRVWDRVGSSRQGRTPTRAKRLVPQRATILARIRSADQYAALPVDLDRLAAAERRRTNHDVVTARLQSVDSRGRHAAL